jgi:acetyl-CoA carboxylase biotin carboxylase subunit
VAAGAPLSFADRDMSPRGHAIEFRINAEDPVTFAPSPGRITSFHPPGGLGVRVDTAAYQGYLIPPYYDSLIAKLIVWGRDREEAIRRGRRALDFFVIEGVRTTIPLHRRILDDPDFIDGKLSTHFMERFAASA